MKEVIQQIVFDLGSAVLTRLDFSQVNNLLSVFISRATFTLPTDLIFSMYLELNKAKSNGCFLIYTDGKLSRCCQDTDEEIVESRFK